MELDTEDKIYISEQVVDAMRAHVNSSLIFSWNFRATFKYVKTLMGSRKLTYVLAKRGWIIKVNGVPKIYVVYPMEE